MVDLELKFAPEADGEIVGYASLFGGPADAVNDVVAPGAFTDSLTAGLPEMLREHKGQPVGEWLAVAEDDIGLRVRGRVTDPATLAGLRAGKLDGLSIGYVATKTHQDQSGRRVLDTVNLSEISVVKRPASSRARVLSVKSSPAASTAIQRKVKSMVDQTVAAGDAADDTPLDTRVSALETSVADIGTRLGKIEDASGCTAKSVKSIETMLRRPGGTVETKSADDGGEVKTFNRFLRHGREALDHIEVKTLRIADDSGAGYLAPAQFVAEIVKNIVLVSPVRSVARVMTTSAPNVILPRRTATTSATWVGETQTRPETQPAYGAMEFPVREMAAYSDISNAMIEDAAFDLAGEIASDLAEQFGKTEGAAFVNGTGVNQPFGFMQSADIQSVNSGSGTTITADSIIDLFHALPTFYAGNAVWGMNRTTLGVVRKLKDSQNRYLVDIGGMGNSPVTTLLGRPVLELPDMPDVAGGACPVVIADFKSGYRIFDRLQMAILRDPYTQQTAGTVRFHARRRVAGSVAKAEAFRKLKISA